METDQHGAAGVVFQVLFFVNFYSRHTRSHAYIFTRATLLGLIATCPSVRLSVRRTPVLCLAERKQDREMYTI